jgi:hypothetical protein
MRWLPGAGFAPSRFALQGRATPAFFAQCLPSPTQVAHLPQCSARQLFEHGPSGFKNMDENPEFHI